MKKLVLLCLFAYLSITCRSQNILSGTWEGLLDDQLLQLNIVKGAGRLCGYSFDYVLNNPGSNCKAFFEAKYDESNKVWVFVGQSFIENNRGHDLMIMNFRMVNVEGKQILRGVVNTRSEIGEVFRGAGTYVELKRVSSKPAKMYPFMEDCIEEERKARARKRVSPIPRKQLPTARKVTPPVKKQVPPVKKVSPPVTKVQPPVKKTIPPAVKKPAPKPPVKREPPVDMPPPQKKQPDVPMVQIPKANQEALRKMAERRRTEVSRVQVNTREIVLKVYDNGIVDNDTVSIFYNGKLLVGRKWLSEKAIIIPITLDENVTVHEITMYAENLGSIPPNTALIIVTAGDKRYELRSSATLDTNAVLVFEYKPK